MPTPYPSGLYTTKSHTFNKPPTTSTTLDKVLDLRSLSSVVLDLAGWEYSCEDIADYINDYLNMSTWVIAAPGASWHITDLAMVATGRPDGDWPLSSRAKVNNDITQYVNQGTMVAHVSGGVVTGFTGSIEITWPNDCELPSDHVLPFPGWEYQLMPATRTGAQCSAFRGTLEIIDTVTPEFLAWLVPACGTTPGPDPDPDPADSALIEDLIGIKLANLNPPSLPWKKYPGILK